MKVNSELRALLGQFALYSEVKTPVGMGPWDSGWG